MLRPALLAILTFASASFAAAPANVMFTSRAGDPAGRNEFMAAVASLPNGRTLASWSEATSGAGGSVRIMASASFDSGGKFVPLGQPPAPAGFEWRAEPHLAADLAGDRIWLCGSVSDGVSTVGVATVEAALAGGSVTWGTPRIVTTIAATAVAIPVTAFAVDSASGALHVLYAPFPNSGPTANLHLFHYRSLDGGVNWSAPAQLSATADSGQVWGPALAAGRPGVLQAAWTAPTPSGGNRVLTRRSTDNGVTWGSTFEVDSIVGGALFRVGQANLVFSAPFSLAMGPFGKHANVPRFAWAEPLSGHLSTFPDPATQPSVLELEPNDSSLTATVTGVGRVWRGGFSSASDVDTWAFSATAGQDLFFTADSGNSGSMQLIVLAPDGVRRLANVNLTVGGASRALWSVLSTGTYFLRLRPNGTPAPGNAYRVRGLVATTPAGRSRDAGDIRLVTGDASGAAFTRATLGVPANGHTEALPSVHHDPLGRPVLAWLGTGNDAGGAGSDLFLIPNLASFSAADVVTVTDSTTDWSRPNLGALQWRLALHREERRLRIGFPDARRGDTDLFTAGLGYRLEFGDTAPAALAVVPGQAGSLPVPVANRSPLVPEPVTVRVSAARDWGAVAPAEADVPPGGETPVALGFVVPDSAAAGPQAWTLELIDESGTVVDTHPVVLEVSPGLLDAAGPAPPALALAPVAPQPARGPVDLRFRLPAAGPVTLEVLGVRGERVRTLHSGELAAGEHRIAWDLGGPGGQAAPSGLYFVRLRAPQGTRVERLVLVR